jgi:ornithine cyclodeaminase
VKESPLPALISRSQVAAGLSLERLIPDIERGFLAFHEGRAPISPVTSLHFPEVRGETHIRAGYFTDGEIACAKVANFFFDNPAKGLPTMDCVVVVSSRRTGRIRALICDGGLLSDLRTAAASAVAAGVLARKDAATVGLVGAG